MRLCFWEVLKDRKRRETTEQGRVSSGAGMVLFKWYRLSRSRQAEPRKGDRASCSGLLLTLCNRQELPLSDVVVPSKPGKGPKRGKQTRGKELSLE